MSRAGHRVEKRVGNDLPRRTQEEEEDGKVVVVVVVIVVVVMVVKRSTGERHTAITSDPNFPPARRSIINTINVLPVTCSPLVAIFRGAASPVNLRTPRGLGILLAVTLKTSLHPDEAQTQHNFTFRRQSSGYVCSAASRYKMLGGVQELAALNTFLTFRLTLFSNRTSFHSFFLLFGVFMQLQKLICRVKTVDSGH
ncbi:hypothetical protein E2C01_065767 [Portunus trituberculatus]|uniref:Uncharacterized protein n=1 Tax=Portunus trituberculatus TaxID=210409 RepID=A0A5B7HP73_PORTR|nr:hypothetical protein [Portunus trituberculatus]